MVHGRRSRVRSASMHPHLAAVFSSLDRSTAALRAAIESVPPARRRERPAPDRWSVAEILEHLSLVEQIFNKRIAGAIDEARQAGLTSENAERDQLPTTISEVLANRAARRQAPDPAQPTGSLDDRAALSAFEAAQSSFRATLTQCDGLALSSVTHAHPFFGSLNAYQWAELIAGHEMRHVEQIREIAGQFSGEPSPT